MSKKNHQIPKGKKKIYGIDFHFVNEKLLADCKRFYPCPSVNPAQKITDRDVESPWRDEEQGCASWPRRGTFNQIFAKEGSRNAIFVQNISLKFRLHMSDEEYFVRTVRPKYSRMLHARCRATCQKAATFFHLVAGFVRSRLDMPFGEFCSEMVEALASGEVALEWHEIAEQATRELSQLYTLPGTDDSDADEAFNAFLLREFCSDVEWWVTQLLEELESKPLSSKAKQNRQQRWKILQEVFAKQN